MKCLEFGSTDNWRTAEACDGLKCVQAKCGKVLSAVHKVCPSGWSTCRAREGSEGGYTCTREHLLADQKGAKGLHLATWKTHLILRP